MSPPRSALSWLDRAGTGAALLLPLFLLHGRAVAEILVVAMGLGFLVRAALGRDWTWLRGTWVRIALAWWAWLVFCSAFQGAGSLLQALGLVRFLLLVAALESWVLAPDATRRWFATLLRLSALYIALQSLLQFATGRNLFGHPRGADGELTGPYQNPRAGAPLSRLLFPAVLPPMERLLGRARPVLAGLLLLAAIGTMVLIGQRMPLLLTGLGLLVTGLLLPRLRLYVVAGAVAAGLVLAATPVASPRTWTRLVTKFTDQMEHLPTSHYGQIAARAVNIAAASPVLGTGFDGFRRLCDEPRFFRGWDGTEGGGAAMCVQHPHNFYLQSLVEGGVPGLLLFAALVLCWLSRLFRGLWRTPDAARVGLFVAALIHLWPFASTTAFTSMPLGGWFFALLGLGLAETQHYISARNGAHDAKGADDV